VKSNFMVIRRKVHGLKAYGLAQDRFQWDFGCDVSKLSLPRAEMKF
jgi:hypothetical protein